MDEPCDFPEKEDSAIGLMIVGFSKPELTERGCYHKDARATPMHTRTTPARGRIHFFFQDIFRAERSDHIANADAGMTKLIGCQESKISSA